MDVNLNIPLPVFFFTVPYILCHFYSYTKDNHYSGGWFSSSERSTYRFMAFIVCVFFGLILTVIYQYFLLYTKP